MDTQKLLGEFASQLLSGGDRGRRPLRRARAGHAAHQAAAGTRGRHAEGRDPHHLRLRQERPVVGLELAEARRAFRHAFRRADPLDIRQGLCRRLDRHAAGAEARRPGQRASTSPRKSAADPDFLLTVDHIKAWEAKHGAINPGEWVVMRTDWDKRTARRTSSSMPTRPARIRPARPPRRSST